MVSWIRTQRDMKQAFHLAIMVLVDVKFLEILEGTRYHYIRVSNIL